MASGALYAKWQPEVALVTGAGSGIGRQLALNLAADGIAIAGIDLRSEGLQTLEKELQARGSKVAWEIADVTDVAALQRAVGSLTGRLGPVDLLIASAGLGFETAARTLDLEAFNAILRVNLNGVGNSIAAVLPDMLERRRGHLVALSSLASYRGLPLMSAYCASKAGVNALMESLRVELASSGILTTTVCPGWIRTPMTVSLKMRVPMLEVEDAAARIMKAIRRRSRFVAFPRGTRWTLALIGYLPRGLGDWMVARMFRSALTR